MAALSDSGVVYTWGMGSEGQLGLGSKTDANFPSTVHALDSKKIVQLSCGGAHTAVVTDKGEAFLFGRGRYGQLGGGDIAPRSLPTPLRISQLQRSETPLVSLLEAGADHNIAMLSKR
eukprot:gnl/Hemi2/25814_TR8683_c0_g1_i1.p1 gnl/Hemi2/25814_TR8683_c0_g1~~gnl/Hemi2/25814_TR8683_c0_g1_i1.p1  ORF type:complete len:118 (+),score=3.74 gnl/Hemi2/25814_TR8683_c0_g1_i1:454-807(+)